MNIGYIYPMDITKRYSLDLKKRMKVIIAAGLSHTVGLKSDGTVVAVGDNEYGQCNVSGWRSVVAIAAGRYYTVGLKSDGTVVAIGDNAKGQCNVSGWCNIVAIAAGWYHTVGLKSDGTCVVAGTEYGNETAWTDIVAIAAGQFYSTGLKSDGTVVAVGCDTWNECHVTGWKDIVAVAAGDCFNVGLKSDGTVYVTGRDTWDSVTAIRNWENIVYMDACWTHTIGLKSDGTCVAGGNGSPNLTGWTDIVAIAAGLSHTVGLKSDGTVVAIGDNAKGQCNVSNWELACYESAGLLISTQPLNLLGKTHVTSFKILGIEPENTSRHVAFKIDDIWNKLTINSGVATLSPLPTQAITASSLIAEGNTVAELEAVTNCSPFVGKLVYPAIALYASDEAEVMPTFGMAIKAEIDTTVNVYSYTDYSQEYVISDGEDVSIISIVAETDLKGNGNVNITARIKQGGTWSEYMALNAAQMQQASAIQLKAVYTVQNTDGSDSAKITGVVIKYNTAGAATSNGTTDIVTVTQCFTNDLVYVHAYCRHKELIDAKINAFCSIRKQPQKKVMYQFGNGTGELKTYSLPDSGINQDTLIVYIDGKETGNFGYNTETSEITITADKDSTLSASYEYGWEMSNWVAMQQGVSQVNNSGNYTTQYTYTIPIHDGKYTVTAIKFELERPEGHVDNEIIGVGTGKRQIIKLPHIARKETIVCNGKWSYDYDSQRLTIIAPEGDDIVISYDWIAESPQIQAIAAGWAD